MKATANQRKAAIALSMLTRSQRRRLLLPLPPAGRHAMHAMLAEIERQGWADRKAVELALGESFVKAPAIDVFATEELVVLAGLVNPVLYARILVACGLDDRAFLLSLLDRNYANQVQQALAETAALPDKLGCALVSSTRRLLASRRGEACVA